MCAGVVDELIRETAADVGSGASAAWTRCHFGYSRQGVLDQLLSRHGSPARKYAVRRAADVFARTKPANSPQCPSASPTQELTGFSTYLLFASNSGEFSVNDGENVPNRRYSFGVVGAERVS